MSHRKWPVWPSPSFISLGGGCDAGQLAARRVGATSGAAWRRAGAKCKSPQTGWTFDDGDDAGDQISSGRLRHIYQSRLDSTRCGRSAPAEGPNRKCARPINRSRARAAVQVSRWTPNGANVSPQSSSSSSPRARRASFAGAPADGRQTVLRAADPLSFGLVGARRPSRRSNIILLARRAILVFVATLRRLDCSSRSAGWRVQTWPRPAIAERPLPRD